MKWNEERILFLDCQTTATHPSQGQILEIAWCIGSTGELLTAPLERHLVRLRQGESIPYRVREMTRITDQEMEESRPQKEVLEVLRQQVRTAFPDGKIKAVAHYAVFEKTFLQAAWLTEFPGEDMPFEFVCTQKIAKFLYPGMTSFSLRAVSGFFGSTLHLSNRADSHVEATLQVWLGIVRELENRSVASLDLLLEQMNAPKPKKKNEKKTFEYRMPREKRLQFPDQPGIYKMFSKDGQILYVGKATSLKSRVNSYFRGGTTKDKRKQELMAQVWDIEVVPCRSPLEAALLESDEIKKWNPRYNVALRESQRPIVYFDREFTTVSEHLSDQFRIGPFKGKERLEQLLEFYVVLQNGELGQPFWDFVEPELVSAGWDIFRRRHDVRDQSLKTVRSLLVVGMNLLRNQVSRSEDMEDTVTSDNSPLEDESLQSVKKISRAKALEHADEADDDLTADEVANKFERMFAGAADNVRRAKKLQRLFNARVRVNYNSEMPYYLHFSGGQLVAPELWRTTPPLDADGTKINSATYDRLSILLSGIQSAHDVAIENPVESAAQV